MTSPRPGSDPRQAPLNLRLVVTLAKVAILGLVSVACLPAWAEETLDAIDRIESEAYDALVQEQFERLNGMADGMRASRDRLPDGRWKLTFVTAGLAAGLTPRDEDAWRARLALIDKWISRTPENATPYLAKAAVLIASAWDARGTGYAASVKEADWPVFRKRMAAAEEVLRQSSDRSGHSPLWYECMQTIAMALNWSQEDFLKLFQNGVREEPTYYPLYFSAATFLLPRWHGDSTQLAQFVDFAVESTEQQEGQTMYARIYWSLLYALGSGTFSPEYANWDRMHKGFDAIVRDYPDNWNLNAYVYYACMAQDWRTAQTVAGRMSSVIAELWGNGETYRACLQQKN